MPLRRSPVNIKELLETYGKTKGPSTSLVISRFREEEYERYLEELEKEQKLRGYYSLGRAGLKGYQSLRDLELARLSDPNIGLLKFLSQPRVSGVAMKRGAEMVEEGLKPAGILSKERGGLASLFRGTTPKPGEVFVGTKALGKITPEELGSLFQKPGLEGLFQQKPLVGEVAKTAGKFGKALPIAGGALSLYDISQRGAKGSNIAGLLSSAAALSGVGAPAAIPLAALSTILRFLESKQKKGRFKNVLRPFKKGKLQWRL